MDNNEINLIVDDLLKLSESTTFEYKITEKDETSTIDFVKVKSVTFENNLRLFDSFLPEILGWMLAYSYLSQNMFVKSCVKKISEVNPMKFPKNRVYDFYCYKIKRILLGFVKGVNSETPWNLEYRRFAWLIITNNEKTIYFNCFEENKIVEYLYNNAKFKICENNTCTINKEMKMYKELSFSIVF